MVRGAFSDRSGFTLLEVLIAFAILAVAVVSLIQLTSQGLRLLKVSGDHQQAVQIADRIARDTQVIADEVTSDATVETGEEGDYAWERRITRIALPEELEPATPVPGKEVPGLYAVAVAVRWGRNHQVEVATLRAPTSATSTTTPGTTDQQGQTQQQGQAPGQSGGAPGRPTGSGTPTTTPGRGQTGSTGSSGASSSRTP